MNLRINYEAHRISFLRAMVQIGFYKLGILLLLLLIMTNCKSVPPPSIAAPSPVEPRNRITIFLVDRSGSFHKEQKEGHFKSQDYFHIACDQIKKYVEQQANLEREQKADQPHEFIIVRVIESASFSDETVAAQIDFTNPDFIFREPEPKGPFANLDKEAWERRKDDFMKQVDDKRDPLVKNFYNKMDELNKRGPSDRTDVINAFQALLQDLKSLPHYFKHIVVYSDFQDNQNKLDSADVLDFGDDTKIEGKFVSVNGLTPKQYENLMAAWGRILKCNSQEFKTPIKSVQ
ncbi:MAG: hypothetical protein DMF61_06400 [Blastocatellia bacterium AA13]|nr:MAG: hypothetical protein DMF61_06400 [Blastocatellia bacterium AA13]